MIGSSIPNNWLKREKTLGTFVRCQIASELDFPPLHYWNMIIKGEYDSLYSAKQ